MSIIEYLPAIWLFIVAVIPISFLIIGIIKFRNKENIKELSIKLLIAIFLYLPVTIFCLVYIVSTINSIEDTKGIIVDGRHLSPSMDYQTLGLFLGYCLFGLGLGWFLKTNLSRSLTKIIGRPQKYETIIKT